MGKIKKSNIISRIIVIYTLMMVILISFTNAQGFGHCSFGDYTFGNCVINSKKSPIFSGSSGSISTPINLINPFGLESKNGSCTDEHQIYDGKCYPCPNYGHLTFNPDDRSVLCTIKCEKGTYYNGTTCIVQHTSLLHTNKMVFLGLLVIGASLYFTNDIIQRKKQKQSQKEDKQKQKEQENIEEEESL